MTFNNMHSINRSVQKHWIKMLTNKTFKILNNNCGINLKLDQDVDLISQRQENLFLA